jgi:proteasome lid subunit RPN8/RPN11
MTIKLNQEQIDAIARHSEQDYPGECCGIMLGDDDGNERTVVALLPQTNQSDAAEQYHRFLITPEMMLTAEKEARARHLDVIGFYHSHPEDEARPSNFDREHAWPWYSYIVVRVRDHTYDKMASWRLEDDRSRFIEEQIIL